MVVTSMALGSDVDAPQFDAGSLGGAIRDLPITVIRPAGAAGRIGRCRQFGDLGHTVRARQPERAFRPQRHRQRFENPAAHAQQTGAGYQLWCGRYAGATLYTWRPILLLYRRLAADHQRASGQSEKAARQAAGAARGEQLHRHLPGVLAPIAIDPGERRRRDDRPSQWNKLMI
jgi:hypothetical protein